MTVAAQWSRGQLESVPSCPACDIYETHLVASHCKFSRKLARSSLEFYLLRLGRMLTLPMRAMSRGLRYKSIAPLRGLYVGAFSASPASKD